MTLHRRLHSLFHRHDLIVIEAVGQIHLCTNRLTGELDLEVAPTDWVQTDETVDPIIFISDTSWAEVAKLNWCRTAIDLRNQAILARDWVYCPLDCGRQIRKDTVKVTEHVCY